MRASIMFGVLLVIVATQAPACEDSSEQGDSAKSGPAAALKGLAPDGSLQVSEADRCPVCAMQVSKHPRFACSIELTDGRCFYFCGTGCLIRSWLHPEVFLKTPKSHLGRAVVQEYFGGKPVDALEAVWVAGSDVVGPMGPALVPLASKDDLETFRKRHGGKTTFQLAEMDDERWETITGKKALPGSHKP
jgi:copper chaperone NosL